MSKIRPRLICSCVTESGLKTEGVLQERLAYRLDVIHIEIPPLRERREEILPLADLFLQEFKVKLEKAERAATEAHRFLRRAPKTLARPPRRKGI